MHEGLRRGLRMLEAIGAGATSPGQLADRLGVDKSTVSRLLTSLADDGWVDRQGGGIALGPRAVLLGSDGVLAATVGRARTLVAAVAGVCGTDACALTLVGDKAFAIALSTNVFGPDVYPPDLGPFPVWSTAAGRVLASMLPHERVLQLLDAAPGTSAAGSAYREELLRSIGDARARHVAVELEEFGENGCVAVPWRPNHHLVPAALAVIAAPSVIRARQSYLHRVLAAAAAPGATRATVLASVQATAGRSSVLDVGARSEAVAPLPTD